MAAVNTRVVRLPAPALLALLLLYPMALSAMELGTRYGPAEDPEIHDDYGGTPDSTLVTELGLSKEELGDILKRLRLPDQKERVEAALSMKRDAAGAEQVIRDALWQRTDARNDQLKAVMQIARRTAAGSGKPDSAAEVLSALLTLSPSSEEHGAGIAAATRIMTMLNALLSLDTLAGYKVMLEFSGRHAGAFRQEIGAMLVSRGFDALPPLVYGRGSRDKELHMFAVKWIRDMGDPLLGEQVQGIRNPRRLAQLLEAYASVNHLNAIDVTLSLANHDSVFVRNAARKCLEVYGRNAKWSLRRMYENTFLREPEDNTDYEQWAGELYAFWDEKRISGTLQVFNKALEAAAAADYTAMDKGFSEVLRVAPLFERRHLMAPGYLAYAADMERQKDPQMARVLTMRALRLAQEGSPEENLARARLHWLKAETFRKKGLADIEAYRQIIEEDPGNEAAQQMVARLDPATGAQNRPLLRATLVSMCIFPVVLLVYARLRRRWVFAPAKSED